MARKTFMAIHTYHNEKTKNEFLSDMPTTETTDVEWKEIYTFEKCQCKATWVGTDDFFLPVGSRNARRYTYNAYREGL